jgi:AcrR family transcriptional regulator
VSLLELGSPAVPVDALDPVATRGRRIADAALRCFARWGVTKTTLEDIAREARYSRATVYRLFPGGKDALVRSVACAEVGHFIAGVARRLDEVAGGTLEDVLVAGMAEAGRRFSRHDALQFVLTHEPETVLPHIAFRGMDEVLRTAGEFARPWLAPHLDDETARRVGEWAARILLSYLASPDDSVDVGDDDSIRPLVTTFLLPGIVTGTTPSEEL